MLDTLGPTGIAGLVVVVAGIALIAYESLLIALGLVLVLAGVGVLIKALVTGMMQTWGLA